MPRLLLPLTFTLLLLSACGDEPSCPSPLTPEGRCLCPSGLMPTPRMTSDAGYDCVPAEDASADADAASMGDADAAIPCDGACEERLCFGDACVACVEAGDCASTPDTPYCSTMNACVACLDSSQCSEAAAPLCDMNVCAPCSEDAHCAGITDDAGTDLNACLTGGDAPTCVECTATNDTACGGNVCDLSTNTCTDRAKGSAGLCQTCVNDTECDEGQLCVLTRFDDIDIGQFCLWREDAPAGPAGDCVTQRPYVDSQMATSINGVMAGVCNLRLTSCTALNQFDMRSCTDGTSPGTTDSECGHPGVDDGLCRRRSSTTNRCTVPCLSNDDCQDGSNCTSTPPRYCDF